MRPARWEKQAGIMLEHTTLMALSASGCEKRLHPELERVVDADSPMRILSVTQSYYPFQDRGGPAFKVRSIARMLTELGNKVTVLTADLGFAGSTVASAGAIRYEQGWRSDLDGVEVIYLSTLVRYRGQTV